MERNRDSEKKDKKKRSSEGQGYGIGRRSGQLGIHSPSLSPLEDCGKEGRWRYVRPQAPADPPRPEEMEQSCGGSVEFGQWAC